VFFQNLRQRFVDWNYVAWGADEFKNIEQQIDAMLDSTTDKAQKA